MYTLKLTKEQLSALIHIVYCGAADYRKSEEKARLLLEADPECNADLPFWKKRADEARELFELLVEEEARV